MDDEQLLNNIRQLLYNTFSNELQVHQSENMLHELSENEPKFADIICYIALNDTDISIKKAAIIQTRNFNSENIVKLFVLFNGQLDPKFHEMITFLSDLLAEKYAEILYSFCISFNSEQANDNFTEEAIIQKKTLMMAIMSLLNNANIQFYSTEEFLKSSFDNNLMRNAQFIHQTLQSNIESQSINLSQQQILFFNYFIQVFYILFKISIRQKDYSYSSTFFDFIHFFLCFSLRFNIDFIYTDLNTKIVATLFGFYSFFFEPNDSSNPLLPNIKFDEIIESYEIFSRNVPIQNWPIVFLKIIKSFFDSEIVFGKYFNYSGQIISNYIYPLFSYKFFVNITDDFEFVDLYYPNRLSNNLQSYAINIIGSFHNNEYLQEMIYKFAYEKLGEMIPNERDEDIFGLINMMSYFSRSNEYLANFCNFIDNHLLNSQEPLVIISIMHFISELPHNFEFIPSNFINFIFAGLFNQIQTSNELLNYDNIIQYFSVLAYTNLLSHNACPSISNDQEKMKYVLEITIGFNEYFKTEEASSALGVIIEYLTEIDEELLNNLVEIVWKLFIEEVNSSSNDCLTSNHISSLISIFKKCKDQVKLKSSEIILNLIDGFLNSRMESEENAKNVFHVLDNMNDEIFSCIGKIIEYLTNILPDDQLNNLFIKIRDEFSIIFNLLTEDCFEWTLIDNIILCFVNLKNKIDHRLLLEFFESFIQLIISRQWDPDELDSLKEFIDNFSSFPDVQVFLQNYQNEIQQIFEIISQASSKYYVIKYPQ